MENANSTAKVKTEVTFCCGKKQCPVVQELDNGMINLGSPEEGITTWNKGQLNDFINAAKEGKFDDLVK